MQWSEKEYSFKWQCEASTQASIVYHSTALLLCCSPLHLPLSHPSISDFSPAGGSLAASHHEYCPRLLVPPGHRTVAAQSAARPPSAPDGRTPRDWYYRRSWTSQEKSSKSHPIWTVNIGSGIPPARDHSAYKQTCRQRLREVGRGRQTGSTR